MRISILSIILVIVGCGSIHTIIKFQKKGLMKLKMKIPEDYIFEGLQGDQEVEHRYWYPDSSVIYITSFENTLNYEDIREQGTYYNRFKSYHNNDTLTLRGISSNGLYWQDKLLKNGVTIGYSKVPKNDLQDFISAIESIEIFN